MNIGLSYINGANHGDQIIYYSTKHILEKCLKENGINDYTIIPVDICNEQKTNSVNKLVDKKKSSFKIKSLNKKIDKTTDKEEKEKLILEKWHNFTNYKLFMEKQMPKLEGLDCFIFSGGGIVKYHAQFYHYMIDMITEYCDENNIAVFIIGAGVEGYDEDSVECKILKDALNRKCVKYISIRDDYKKLKDFFMVNEDIETENVCDPAFWSAERYRIKVPPVKRKLIGINVIRTAIWKDYMYDINEKKLFDVYYGLIEKLLADGYAVELFSNGVPMDRVFITELFAEYPALRKYMEEGIITVYTAKYPRMFMKRIAEYERFIAVRLHSSIVGTSMGVPNISLVWCVKQPLFGEQTGTLDNFIMKENFDVDYIYNKLMNAKPYEVPDEYRNSVYLGLNRQIKKYLVKKED